LRSELGEKIVAESGADFDAPLVDYEAKAEAARKAEERAKREAKREQEMKKRGEKPDGTRDLKKRPQRRRDRSGGPRPSRPR
jgi:23S rRNA pseudouridine2605 synthase